MNKLKQVRILGAIQTIAGLPAYWIGLSGKDSLIVGIGMSGRGGGVDCSCKPRA